MDHTRDDDDTDNDCGARHGTGAGALGAGEAAGFDPPMFKEMVAGGEGAAVGGGVGLEPPMFREIVGGGGGASV